MWRMIPLLAVVVVLAVWANTPRETPREAEVTPSAAHMSGSSVFSRDTKLEACLDTADAEYTRQMDSATYFVGGHGYVARLTGNHLLAEKQQAMEECRLRYGR